MVVQGSLDSIQSDFDFYLSITSRGLISDSDEMRKRFFDIFKKEDSYRKENFLLFQERVCNDYSIVEDCEPVLEEGEECYVSGTYSFADDGVSEDCPDDCDVYEDEFVSSEYLEEEKDVIEFDDFDSHNEDTFIESEYTTLEEENTYLAEEDESFEEEYDSLEKENNNLEIEEMELDDDEFIDYGSSEIENNDLETEENDSFISWGTEDYSEEVVEEFEEEFLDEVVEEFEEEEDLFTSWGTEDCSEEFSDEVVEEEVEGLSWGTDDTEDELECFDVVKDEKPSSDGVLKNRVVEVKETKVEEEVKDIPRDLREFVKMYHNCEMSFALKYFTKKEIDKQLSLGRVFKRKNRLLI